MWKQYRDWTEASTARYGSNGNITFTRQRAVGLLYIQPWQSQGTRASPENGHLIDSERTSYYNSFMSKVYTSSRCRNLSFRFRSFGFRSTFPAAGTASFAAVNGTPARTLRTVREEHI